MKVIKILFLSLFLSLSLNAKVVTSTNTKSSTGEGVGLTREEAINNAIIEAVGKMGGVNINSLRKSNSSVFSNGLDTTIQDHYSEQISKATKGRVDSYEINSIEQDENGKYMANVTIFKTTTTKKYQAPGLSADNRRSISVFDSTPDPTKRGIGAALQQKIITNLLQSRKFNVLDRDSNGYYEMEKALIQSGNAAKDEIYKLKNVLGTDYILLFSISALDGKQKTSNLTGKSKMEAEVVIDYRVLLFATRQIKFANTLSTKVALKDDSLSTNEQVLGQIARQISNDILNAIYPLKVAGVENGEIIFSQNLNQGDVYECFSLGKAIKDSYTKETTGRIETKSGSIEVTRSTPKLSYAKITEGSVKVGDICRPLSNSGSGNGYTIGRDANYKVEEGGGVNLGF
ncbi:CsgG/HfaB family protein [Campylobacter upsaliensis]|uniref:CsgG/HfaB family protein n=1 Tax=Campylobacter upsaliensis TaxID=28080 RepID=UPI0022EA892D|nr:CsgG/HfaB family protein [Campylobacter upsaliensis]MEB2807877.1 CsgG/HfaB family protein [Campylobacter upsaliensis]MEB2819638.1 CsgG/HfaB family protein [Campylobacter upsaliensis]